MQDECFQRGSFAAVLCFALTALCILHARGHAQTRTKAGLPAAQARTLAQITAIRDDFVKRVHSSGLACALQPPRMEVREVASFGEYDAATNTVASTDWTLLSSEQRAIFFKMAGPNANAKAAHATFEETMHRSMLVHELAHWWEACHKVGDAGHVPPFQQGVRADRIAVAYWREAEPSLPGKIAVIAQGLVDHSPSPVPVGQRTQDYFDRHYEEIGPSAQPWFGAQFYLAAYEETPRPTLSRALALTAK